MPSHGDPASSTTGFAPPGPNDGTCLPPAPTATSVCNNGVWYIPPGSTQNANVIPITSVTVTNGTCNTVVCDRSFRVTGDLTIGPDSTLVFNVDEHGTAVLIVMGCLYFSNGSRVALSLYKEPVAGQYDVANAACVSGRPLAAVKVRRHQN